MERTVALRRRSEAEASKDERSRRATCEPRSLSVQHEFRIGEIGQPRAMRALEIFAAAPLGIKSRQGRGWARWNRSNTEILPSRSSSRPMRAGAGGVFGGARGSRSVASPAVR